jgi:hypothetical protein
MCRERAKNATRMQCRSRERTGADTKSKAESERKGNTGIALGNAVSRKQGVYARGNVLSRAEGTSRDSEGRLDRPPPRWDLGGSGETVLELAIHNYRILLPLPAGHELRVLRLPQEVRCARLADGVRRLVHRLRVPAAPTSGFADSGRHPKRVGVQLAEGEGGVFGSELGDGWRAAVFGGD